MTKNEIGYFIEKNFIEAIFLGFLVGAIEEMTDLELYKKICWEFLNFLKYLKTKQ